jgi:CheY-like chemotaxis protein
VSPLPARFRVLVVEDEALIGMLIEDALEDLGHEIVGPVGSLDEALELATHEPLDFAILDVNIRGGYSYPVADVLLQRGLPMLMTTGYDASVLPDRIQEQRRLRKPFTVEQLEAEILLMCSGQKSSTR